MISFIKGKKPQTELTPHSPVEENTYCTATGSMFTGRKNLVSTVTISLFQLRQVL